MSHPTQGKYKLVGKEVIEVDDLMEWAEWMEENVDNMSIALDEIGDTRVSTVFLGLDFSYVFTGNLRIFETMTFKDGKPGDQFRYATWDRAIEGHNSIVEELKRKEVDGS